MPDRAEGVVLARAGNLVTVEVQGVKWELHWWQVDCGHEYQTPRGEWIREPDPRVRQYVESMLQDPHGTPAGGGPMRDYWIDQCTWVLERNGW